MIVSDARLNKSRLIRFQLRFVASIFLTSVRASSWPYHEIVGVGQSAGPLLVAPVYGVAPAVSLLPAEPAKKAQTIVAGPVTKTVVEGSSSGPVTIVSPGTAVTSSPPPTTLSNLSFGIKYNARLFFGV